MDILENFDKKYQRTIFRRKLTLSEDEEAKVIYTFIMNYTQDKSVKSAIIININVETYFRNMLGDRKGSYIVIYDKDHNIWAESSGRFSIDLSQVWRGIGKQSEKMSHTEYTKDGEKYFISESDGRSSGIHEN